MLKTKILLIGIFDTNTVALAPEFLRSYVERFPISEAFDIRTLNLSMFTQSVDEMARLIRAEGASIVGFSTYIWNVSLVRALAERLGESTIMLGGPQMNYVEPDFFEKNPSVDFCVVGEGEETFKELLEYFAGGRPLGSIRGIVARGLRTEERPMLVNVDDVPSPYPRIFEERRDLEWIAYETSRGCPFLCGFCTWGYGKKMRYHRQERVFADLDLLLAQPTLKRIYLCDSSILLKKDRAKAILRRVIDKNRRMVLRYEFNAEHLDDEIIDLLLELPENEFNFGVQTINPPALKVMRRPFHRNKFETNYQKMARRTERTSITMDVIYGLPGDDLEGYKKSIDYCMSFDHVKWILTNPLILLPGSDYYRDRERHGFVLRDEESYMVESTATFAKEQMEEAKRISFWVSTIFFNAKLREAIKAFARARNARTVDTVIDLFESLPFQLLDVPTYPYMVPSLARDFRHRNLAVYRVVALYPAIVEWFDEWSGGRYSEELLGWESAFVDVYYRLAGYARGEAERLGVPPPALPRWRHRAPPCAIDPVHPHA